MKKNFNCVRNVLMTKALTLLGFSSPLALMACYGTPTTEYPTEAYVEVNQLSAQKGDSTSLSIVAEGKWEIVEAPDFVTLSADSGEGTAWITVKAADDNLTNEYREGEIVIRDENGEQGIYICQQPVEMPDEVAEEPVEN
ncbi:MAG: BACON domain-containing protein [Prevotella sp.]|nr:BACON domain-containing protein [Prevotella sp.]